MNNEVGFETLLSRAFAQTRRETHLPVVFGGGVGSQQQFAITHVSGGLTHSLSGLVIRSGQGIGGLALASGKVATVPDYLDSRQITHHYDSAVSSEQLRSIVAAPVVVNREVRAVLYGADRSDAPFGPRLLSAFQECASRLAFEVAVAEATTRRLREMETAAALEAARRSPRSPAQESVRAAHAELLELARATDDDELRGRLSAIASQFATAADPEHPGVATVSLSARETEVMALVALGCTNLEIAGRLRVERETVKSYLRNCMRKLEVHSRTAAVTRARALGVLP